MENQGGCVCSNRRNQVPLRNKIFCNIESFICFFDFRYIFNDQDLEVGGFDVQGLGASSGT